MLPYVIYIYGTSSSTLFSNVQIRTWLEQDYRIFSMTTNHSRIERNMSHKVGIECAYPFFTDMRYIYFLLYMYIYIYQLRSNGMTRIIFFLFHTNIKHT